MGRFTEILNGPLYGVMSWEHWDKLREQLGADSHQWYVYNVGHGIPLDAVSRESLRLILSELNELLRRDHEEKYLGIVYVDNFDAPELVKIYDPNNLGSSCGSSGSLVPPGWVLSIHQPDPIASDIPLPNNRRRWWEKLLDKIS